MMWQIIVSAVSLKWTYKNVSLKSKYFHPCTTFIVLVIRVKFNWINLIYKGLLVSALILLDLPLLQQTQEE